MLFRAGLVILSYLIEYVISVPVTPTSSAGPTSWSEYACKTTTATFTGFTCTDPATTYAAITQSACLCPDGNFYELISGGETTAANWQCPWVSPSGEFEVAAPTACPTSTPSDTKAPAATSPPVSDDQITVTYEQPETCSSSALAYSTKTAVPTGYIIIKSDDKQGWGLPGAVWNVSADDSVELSDLKAQCQGSACTGITGNTEYSGKVTQNKDGSWSFTVTPDMQQSVLITGSAGGSGANLVDGKFDLSVVATPKCALPIAQNCSARSFDPQANQWAAYSMDTWLSTFVTDNKVNGLADLFAKLNKKYIAPVTAENFVCEPSAGETYDCKVPDYPGACDASSIETTRGFLAVATLTKMSNMLALLYQILRDSEVDAGDYMPNLVVAFFKPAAEQKWTAIVAAVGAVVGLLTFFAILLDAFTEGAATGAVVALIVGVANTLGAVAAFKNGFQATPPDATYLAVDGNYTQGVVNFVNGLEADVDALWTSTAMNLSSINSAFAGGSWLSLPDPDAITNIEPDGKAWLDTLIVSSYINLSWRNNDIFIVFIPYGTVGSYTAGSSGGTTTFAQKDCETHWNNDPGWPFWSACDLKVGDQAGMAVLTRPSKEAGKGGSKVFANVDFAWSNYVWNAHDAVESSLTGYYQHGFGYNLTQDDFASILKDGPGAVQNEFQHLPLSAAGLFNIPVCVISSLNDVPDVYQIEQDINNKPVNHVDYSLNNPTGCAGSKVTPAAGGPVQAFTDNVSPAISSAVSGS